jgi:hypothetical protein
LSYVCLHLFDGYDSPVLVKENYLLARKEKLIDELEKIYGKE